MFRRFSSASNESSRSSVSSISEFCPNEVFRDTPAKLLRTGREGAANNQVLKIYHGFMENGFDLCICDQLLSTREKMCSKRADARQC